MDDATDIKPLAADGSLRFWILLAVGAALVCVVLMVRPHLPGGGHGVNHSLVGRSLGELHLVTLDSDAIPVSLDDLRGHVALVNFWGTWCPPCRLEFPHMVRLAEEHRGDGRFRFLAVSCGYSPDEKLDGLRHETDEFLAAQRFDVSAYADPRAQTRRAFLAAARHDTFSYPTTLVLDPQGIVRGCWVGYRPGDEDDVAQLVERLLAAAG